MLIFGMCESSCNLSLSSGQIAAETYLSRDTGLMTWLHQSMVDISFGNQSDRNIPEKVQVGKLV